MQNKRLKTQAEPSSEANALPAPDSDAIQHAGSVAASPPAPSASGNAVSSDASQLAASVTVTKTLSVLESAICYPCALGREIQKNIKCAKCDTKRNGHCSNSALLEAVA